MHKRIAMFNHKGGVSKTTTAFHLGWMLASRGHRVVLVDADPQCNLSGLILGFKGETEFEKFYEADGGTRNIRSGLAPAFESQPRAIEPVECVHVPGCDRLFLLPGHIRLSEYEVTLGIAPAFRSSDHGQADMGLFAQELGRKGGSRAYGDSRAPKKAQGPP